MNNALMGLETEYAFTLLGHGKHALDKRYYAESLLTLAAQHYPALYGRDKYDLFLANGSRIYVDYGMGLLNLEYSTPECTSPQELVAHVRAGDRIFAGLARKLERKHAGLKSAFISKTNIDYCGHTSGSHENLLHAVPLALLPRQLIPHLVSRIIYSGSGGFDETVANIEFMLSPRVRFLEHEISAGAQSNRAIFTTRREPMSNSRFGRLHLLCGEGVRYDMSEYLRFGVTALILRLVDAGLSPGRGIEMNSLQAINRVARDIHCKARIGTLNGAPVSAIDIQRHYLDQVQAQLGESILPDWAEQLCCRWQATLDGLEADPETMAGILDWPTRLGLYRAFAEQKGYDWQDLTSNTDKPRRAMRARLFEFDIRLGDIADDGLFATLGKDLENGEQFINEQAIAAALRTPPLNSRARQRGGWIARLSEQRDRLACDWNRIVDRVSEQSLLFDDPLGSRAVNWVAD
jgi:hypothetical protein